MVNCWYPAALQRKIIKAYCGNISGDAAAFAPLTSLERLDLPFFYCYERFKVLKLRRVLCWTSKSLTDMIT